ncbi:Hypothetical predicted protein [Mytilus galloprovincialis]|uniref:Short-chain collagen C4 n=2 Tax=Mytilus galloprovincialis TaxID=29158 RepID=A0A8B6EX65_MYTGA|nr:Hypothetical predicted protein [Mytilus galloprovincialis]
MFKMIVALSIVCHLVQSKCNTESGCRNVALPLMDSNLEATLTANINTDKLNEQLKSYISQEIEQGNHGFVTNVTTETLKGAFENLDKKIDTQMKSLESKILEQNTEINHLKAKGITRSTYIRWGRTVCPGEANIVYDGTAAGKHYGDKGSGANYLCLPKNPEWNAYVDGTNGEKGLLYGVEYEISGNTPYPRSLHSKITPCVVCLAMRSTVLMVPAKRTCSHGWHKEFSGYLMSYMSTSGRTATEYICVDETLESRGPGSSQAELYPVEAICGSLKCPPYVQGREITCVVCSK